MNLTPRTTLNAACCLLAVALLSPPAGAHHSFPAQYDAEQTITLTGTVTEVQWTNPHIFIVMDVADAAGGAAKEWTLELGGPNALLRLGWKRDSLKAGDRIVVDGSLARNGSQLVNANSIILEATGKRMLAGSSKDAGR
jgi:hypothetical protein